ncbi:MAG TPA: hypothetical protein VF832_16235 [Longimicrobiales bacterium]
MGRPPLVLAVALLAAACGASDQVTGNNPPPSTGTACAGSGTISLTVNQSARVDCSAGTTVTLAGNGASYLVVPNFASGEPLRLTPTQYRISATGASATAAVLPVASPAAISAAIMWTWSEIAAGPRPGALQASFDAALRSRAARLAGGARGRWGTGVASGARAAVQAGPLPAVGSLRTFHVVSTLDTVNVAFKVVTARLLYVGTNILLYEDTLAPANGFTPSQVTNFALTFDQVLYPIDANAFGPPSDVDQNGRLVMLMTPVVNGLTPRAQCTTQGYVAGFFDGGDLVNRDTTSNGGEVFYTLVPDPSGLVSCPHTAGNLEDELGATFLHELQHLINFSQHVLVRHSSEEEGWLDEGLSLVAEELGSMYYEQKYPPPSGRSNPAQLFPDSAEGYIGGLLGTSYDYLRETDTTSLTLHSDDQGGLSWRAGDWLMMHWLGDQKGTAIYKALDESALTGIANIEAQAGQPFTTLFSDFSMALYVDSLTGIPRSQIPAANRFTTRNLRQLYARLFTISGPSGGVPFAFPIQPVPLSSAGTAASLVPGSMAFYRLNASSSASTVTITWATPSGSPLPLALRPQLSIYRLPPGT